MSPARPLATCGGLNRSEPRKEVCRYLARLGGKRRTIAPCPPLRIRRGSPRPSEMNGSGISAARSLHRREYMTHTLQRVETAASRKRAKGLA